MKVLALAGLMLCSFIPKAQLVTFTNVADSAGLSHTYDNILHGVGISFKDFSGDGWDDLTIGSGPGDSITFYVNQGGVFQKLPLYGETGAHKMVLWGDYDNDSDQDLFVCGWMTPSKLLHNNGNLNFTDVTTLAGLPGAPLHASGASWGDYDRDGWIDLYINMYENTVEKNLLFRNLGDGIFEDATISSGVIDTPMYSFCSVFMDIDNDLWPDLYVANDYGDPNRMYHNLTNGTFSNFGDSSGTSIPSVDAMSTTAGDYNNDGFLDIYVTNTPVGNVLLRNNQDNTFTDLAAAAHVEMGGWSWGANWFDHDRDGDVDLYVNATFVSPLKPLSAMYDNLFTAGLDSFHHQPGTGFFSDNDEGRAQAIGDWNNDGWLDVAVTGESTDSLRLWSNNGGTPHNWLKVYLKGTMSNRDGTGSRIVLTANGRRQHRFTMGGTGYINQNSADEFFGVDSAAVIDSVVTYWPSGIIDTIVSIGSNQRITIVEGGYPVPDPVITPSGPTVFCPGGSVTLDAGPWTSYKWSTGDTSAQIIVSSPGLYNVTVTNTYGIPASATVPIEVIHYSPVHFTMAVDDVSCHGANNGEAVAQVSSGTAPFTFGWSNGAITAVNTNLAPGSYFVTVSDANSCSNIKSAVINQPTVLANDIINLLHPTCNGYTNGTVDQAVTGGTLPYTFAWSNGSTAQDLLNVGGGEYSVVTTDANACQLTDTFLLTDPSGMTLAASASPAQCNGLDDGSIDLTVSDAKLPLSFLWSNNVIAEDITGLATGNYTVTVTDSAGCTKSLTASVGLRDSLVVIAVIDSVICNGESNGAIDISVMNGDGGYNFSWSNQATSEDITMLAAGDYVVTVTDSTGCEVTQTIYVDGPPAIQINITPTPVNCFGGMDGAALAAASGGNGGFTFLWSTTETTDSIINLSALEYSVTATDRKGCQSEKPIAIAEPGPIDLSWSLVDAACHGAASGSIDLSVAGGQGGFGFLWSTSATTEDLLDLPAGTYGVTTTDISGCSKSASVMVSEATMMEISLSIEHASCGGHPDGSIFLMVTGGTPGYRYLWNTLDTIPSLGGLDTGLYSATVTDANGCAATASCVVDEPDSLGIVVLVEDVSCFGGQDGSLNLTITGGTPPFIVLWSDSVTAQLRENLTASAYTAQVTDAHGCIDSGQWLVDQPMGLVLSGTSTPDTSGSGVGSASVEAQGGTPPYAFQWNDPLHQTASWATQLEQGQYMVVVADAHDCRDSLLVEVGSVSAAPALAIGAIRVCPNPANTFLILYNLPHPALVRIITPDGRSCAELRAERPRALLDVSDLAVGVYVLEVESPQLGRSYVKLVVN